MNGLTLCNLSSSCPSLQELGLFDGIMNPLKDKVKEGVVKAHNYLLDKKHGKKTADNSGSLGKL